MTADESHPVNISTKRDPLEGDALLTPPEVSALFRVNVRTVNRWAQAGKIDSIRTPGGRRLYRETAVRALLGGRRAGKTTR